MVDVELMVTYWKELLDYLGYDNTFNSLFLSTYNARFNFEEDIKLPIEVRYSRAVEVEREVKKAIARDKIKKFWMNK